MFQQYIWLNDKYVVQLTKSDRLGCQKVRQGPPQLWEQWELQRKASDHSTPHILTPCLQPKETQVNFCKGGDFSETVQRTPCKKMTTPPSPRFLPSSNLLPSVILIVPVPLTPSSLPFYPFIPASTFSFLSSCCRLLYAALVWPGVPLSAENLLHCYLDKKYADNAAAAADNFQWKDSLSTVHTHRTTSVLPLDVIMMIILVRLIILSVDKSLTFVHASPIVTLSWFPVAIFPFWLSL